MSGGGQALANPSAAPQVPTEIAASGAPTVEVTAIDACPLCGSSEHSEVAYGYDYELQTCANRWRFVACSACSLIRLHPRPSVSALSTIYPPSYYAYNFGEISPVARWGKQALDGLKFRAILDRLDRDVTSYLDIGCGDGRYMKLMDGRGIPRADNYGLELDETVIAPLAAAGYQAFCERVEECERIPDGRIDLATMFHVIEHVDDPAVVLRQISRWLSPGGVLAIETPNVDSWDRKLFSDTWWGGYHIPRHWTLFSPGTLERMLRECGLEVIATQFQTGHAFWMYSFHHRLRYGPHPRPRLARVFDPFKSVPVLMGFTAFDKLRAAARRQTSAMLMIARKPA